MNKKEIKDAFEKEFEQVTVSDELKQKTLKILNAPLKKPISILPYIRNLAAVFIVTLLCLSIYLAKTYPVKDHITSDMSSDSQTTSENKNEAKISNSAATATQPEKAVETEALPSDNFSLSSSLDLETSDEYVSDFPVLYSTEIDMPDPSIPSTMLRSSKSLMATPDTENSITSEDEFIQKYPDAEKVDNGYVIYENGKETLYVFKDKVLENIIVID